MPAERESRLSAFVDWVQTNLSGDEKGEAQIFLDRLFGAFGLGGVKEAGATLEARIRKQRKGVSFADLIWKPIVLIEMKKRGSDLSVHYQQAFSYWVRAVPKRPQYVVLCNFDEFWVYDFDIQLDTPVDRLKLTELPTRYGPLAFLFPTHDQPVFGNNQQEVTKSAAALLSRCFRKLIKRKTPRELAQRFILQTLVALFAEDIGLLPRYFFTRLLEECTSPTESFDLLGGLFSAMNSRAKDRGGRFKEVQYFNGGLFAKSAKIELSGDEVDILREAAKFDWSRVRPEIFGTIFEQSLDEERRKTGAHFTSATDIMKIVGPTVVDPWHSEIESAETLRDLSRLLERLETYQVLDPACGSGNFLYIAYRELKRVESNIYERMNEFKSINMAQRPFGFLTTKNFHGMDINPFAVELAKVTLMLAHKLAIDEFHVNESALPLDNLDRNFLAVDALIDANGLRTPWPKADAIIGNPPFIGTKLLKKNMGMDYANELRSLYPEVPGMADYCVYWFRRAQDQLAACTPKDLLAGRAGLVGTQNIRNNQSRVGGLDYIVKTGTIVDAVDNEPWSGEANVHVSIVNWIKTKNKPMVPRRKRLWQKDTSADSGQVRLRGSGPASKIYQLSYRDVPNINSALSDEVDVSSAVELSCNTSPQRVFQGITPGHKGFVLSKDELKTLAREEKKRTKEVIHPYLIGDEIVSGAEVTRFVIDFGESDLYDAKSYGAIFDHVSETVLPSRKEAVKRGRGDDGTPRPHHVRFLNHWWKLSWGRGDMLAAISGLSRYMACSRVTKRPIFDFVSSQVWPGDALQVFAFEDDYSFGVLQSDLHWRWFVAKCSKLKSDFRYTPPSVFDTFPWPQSPSAENIESVASAGRQLRKLRATFAAKVTGGLRELYRAMEEPGENALRDAHAELDRAVRKAYGFKQQDDALESLLDLNQEVATAILRGDLVTGPGIPDGYSNGKRLVSSDCIMP